MARKIADHKMTPDRQDAIQTLTNMGLIRHILAWRCALSGASMSMMSRRLSPSLTTLPISINALSSASRRLPP